jgi:phage gp36-like protein
MAYATLKDIFLRWGETNVRDAANLNADNSKSVKITNRIKHFLQIHSDEIEARLMGCAYKIPFDPVPPVIRNLCVELAYIALYRVKHSTDSTAPDPFAYVTARHNQIFADIHARRLRLGGEQQSIDVPMIVGGKPFKVKTKEVPVGNLAKIHTDGTLQGDGTKQSPLSVVSQELTIDLHGIDVSHLPDYSFVAIGTDGFVEADSLHPKVIGFKVGEKILTQGIVKNDQWNWNVGEYVMLGDGGLTQTAEKVLMRVGVAIRPNLVMLKLEYGFLEDAKTSTDI